MTNTVNAPASSRRQAILVLGMHRSGTSAVSGVINARGATAPKTLMIPLPDNPRGYFESSVIAIAHDALLASAGSRWDDWRQFDLKSISPDVAEHHRQQIKALLIDEFGDAPLLLIKDPRICRFVPFTLSILSDLNIDPVAILPVRNPLEVAYSLGRRGLSISTSLLLWLRHVLEAEHQSRHLPRYFLPYEKFLVDWRSHMNRAAETVGITWPDRSDLSDDRICQFLTSDLWRERASVTSFRDHPQVTPMVRETYGILAKIIEVGENTELLGQLDRLRSRFDESCELFAAVMTAEEMTTRRLSGELAARDARAVQLEHEKLELATLSEQRLLAVSSLTLDNNALIAERDNLSVAKDALIEECDRLSKENSYLLTVRHDMFSSHSWRLTAPLRWLRELFVQRS